MPKDSGLWLHSLQGRLYKQPAGGGLCFMQVWSVWSQNGQAVTNSDASAASLEGFQAVIKSAASAASPGPKFVEK